MLAQAGLDDMFWAEAVTTAAYLRNLTTSNAIVGRTPMEMLTGRSPYVGHLRCFGCEVWVFVSHRKKLDSKSRGAFLLGCLLHRNYRVWDIESGCVYHMRHVRINESLYPALERQSAEVDDNALLQKWIDGMYRRASEQEGHQYEERLRASSQDRYVSDIPEDARGGQGISPSEDVLESLTHYPERPYVGEASSSRTERYPERERRPPVRLGDDTVIPKGNDTALKVVKD